MKFLWKIWCSWLITIYVRQTLAKHAQLQHESNNNTTNLDRIKKVEYFKQGVFMKFKIDQDNYRKLISIYYGIRRMEGAALNNCIISVISIRNSRNSMNHTKLTFIPPNNQLCSISINAGPNSIVQMSYRGVVSKIRFPHFFSDTRSFLFEKTNTLET